MLAGRLTIQGTEQVADRVKWLSRRDGKTRGRSIGGYETEE